MELADLIKNHEGNVKLSHPNVIYLYYKGLPHTDVIQQLFAMSHWCGVININVDLILPKNGFAQIAFENSDDMMLFNLRWAEEMAKATERFSTWYDAQPSKMTVRDNLMKLAGIYTK